MDIRTFKEQLFKAGMAAGLEEMEIYISRSKDFSVRVFQSEVDDYTLSVEQGVGFRAFYQGKVGSAYVEVIDEQSVDFLVESAKANAQIIDSTDEIIFYAGAESYPQVKSFSKELEAVSAEAKIEYAKALEAEALAIDGRVSMVNYALTGYGDEEVYIANTKGLEQSFCRNGAFSYISAVVKENEQVKTGGRMIFNTDWQKFNAQKQSQDAVGEALSLLGASSVKSGDYRVLLRYDVVRTFLSTFSSVFSAEAVQKGLSLLQGKLGEQIASSIVTLVDDPLMENGGASAPFDGEGVATSTKKVIDGGSLTTYLHNLKTAKKDGVESTGNASRPSFKSPVGISPSNFYIEPGHKNYEQLIKELDNGIIVINVQGAHSGANAVSGDFSLGAYGYLVENGRIVRAVDQITVAGNFFTLLKNIEEVGSDLEFGSPGHGGNIGSPSLIISQLSIAGM